MRDQFAGLAIGWAVAFTALATHAAPPPEQTTPQWADEYRQIAAESGARLTGQWDTSTAPYLRRPMEVAGVDHPAASVWLCWSAKTGKTQVPLNAAFHCIDTAPRSIMVVCASDQKQKDFEREIFSPAVRATPRINLKVMATRSRSGEGSTTYHKRFRGGFLKIVNAGSEAQLQQSDIGLIIFEEPTSYPKDVGGRGHPIRQARTRTLAWGDDAKEIGGGTPGIVGDCHVTDEVERRTCERYYLPCPHCGALQVLKWENRDTADGRPHFRCQADDCGCLIGHEHKLWMLAEADAGNGGWVPCFRKVDDEGQEIGDNPAPPDCFPAEDLQKWLARDTEGRDPSFTGIWQAYSPFTTWARIWAEYEEAISSGDPEDLVTFYQQTLGLPFESAYERPAKERLFETRAQAARIARVERGRIPPWAWSIYLTADVQGDRIEWAAYAFGRERRGARIDSGVIPVPPVDPRAWNALAEITQRKYEGPLCRPIGFDRIGVDTGGHHTSQAYTFCSGRPNVMALAGARGPNSLKALPLAMGSTVTAKIAGRTIARTQLYLVGTHKLKKDIYFGLAQTLAGLETGEHLPGAFTLDPDATETDYAQLTAEVLLPPDPAKRRKYEVWEPQPAGARNEQLDLAVYARALAWSFLPDAMRDEDWDRLIADRARDPARDGELPLEGLWSGRPAETADPSAAPTADPIPPPPSQAVEDRPLAAPADAAARSDPGAPPVPSPDVPQAAVPAPAKPFRDAERAPDEHPLMRLARRNLGGDA
jgi:phage terminase large subunit GpA-like protein